MKIWIVPSICALSMCLFLAAGCGGDGSGSSAGSLSGTGTTLLLVKDFPPTDIDGFVVTIEKATLLGDDGPHVLFEGEQTVDLLDHRDQEFLLALDEVPAGTYNKIRLAIRDPQVSPNPNNWPVFVPGGGKLDLNPRGEFTIVAGETTTIRLDFDVANSVHVVLTGNQRFIVRPVVFVDIEAGPRDPIGITDLTGTVVASDDFGEAIDVDLDLDAGTLTVVPGPEFVVLDEALLPILFDTIEPGDRVLLRGMLTTKGELEASVILLGDPLRLRGELPEGTLGETWSFEPDVGAPLIGTITATNVPEARAIIEGGESIDPDLLPPAARARITGRYFATESLLRAALLDLEAEPILGTIVAVDLSASPMRFTVADESGLETELAFDATTGFPLTGGGEVLPDFLRTGLKVDVSVVGTLAGLPRAWRVRVTPQQFEGAVASIDLISLQLDVILEGEALATALFLRPDARILQVVGAASVEIGLDEVMVGDTVEALGLLDPADQPQVWVLIVL